MANKTDTLTTKQFSEMSGMPVATVTRMIREGRIKAKKQSGRWMIPKDQLGVAAGGAPPLKASAPDRKKPAAAPPKQDAPFPAAKSSTAGPPGSQPNKTLGITEFAALTYLTEYGVTQWLKKGRLSGRQDENGNWQVDATNLDHPHIQRLLR